MSLELFERYLRDVFCEHWKFTREENSIIFSRDFGVGVETIRITHENDAWYVTIKILDRTNELYNPSAVNAHRRTQLSKKDGFDMHLAFMNELDEVGHQEMNRLGNISYGTIIEHENCNIRWKHKHHYYTDYVFLETKNDDIIISFITCRYLFFNINGE